MEGVGGVASSAPLCGASGISRAVNYFYRFGASLRCGLLKQRHWGNALGFASPNNKGLKARLKRR